MACTVLVIVSPQTGPGELVKYGESRYILNSVLDLPELAGKIRRFVEDLELSRLTGGKGEQIACKHSWDTTVAETMEVFGAVYAENSDELSVNRR